MASLLSTLFASRDNYLTEYISKINIANSFPLRHRLNYQEFIGGIGDKSVIISGGTDEERSCMILGMVKSISGRIIILHNGNRYFRAEVIRGMGVKSEDWDCDIYKGMHKTQILSLLSGEVKDEELLFFYAYAFDVCEVLGLPVSIDGVRQIDWLGISWQQELLENISQRNRAHDLLNRFDKDMAERAVKGMCRIERLSRNNGGAGKGLGEILLKDVVLTKEVYGSDSAVTRQCLEAVQALAEEGVQLTLILDDVFLPDMPVIRDNYRNVRLILSADDVTTLSGDMRLTSKSCSMVAFGHANYRSAKLISEIYFGEYDKLENDVTTGDSKTFLTPVTHTMSITVKRGRELRIKPEKIVNLPPGVALVHLSDGQEGTVRIRKDVDAEW